MSNINNFEVQIKEFGFIPIEVRLRNGKVHWFITYDSTGYFLIIYDGLGKAYAADFIMHDPEVPIHGIVRCKDDTIVTTVGSSTIMLVRYGKRDLYI